jgi:exopolysaccharide biosynthesis polyprenyl glycosylphosphotransferase
MSTRYSKYLPGFIFLCDVLLLNLALYNSHFITFNIYNPQNTSAFVLIINLSWIFVSALTKNFSINRPLQLKENINRFLLTLIYNLLIVFGIIFFFKIDITSRSEVLITYSLFFLFVIINRSLLFFFLDHIRKQGYNHRQIVIVGDGNIAARLVDSFSQHPEYGYDLVDFISENEMLSMTGYLLEQKLLTDSPDEIFICYRTIDEGLLSRLIAFANQNFIKIKVVSDLILNNNNYAQLVNYHSLPVLHITPHPEISLKIRVLKRSFDILFSLIAIVFGSPVFVMLYLITKFSSKGPALYKQERVGLNEKPFYIYKFRSMCIDAERNGPQLSSATDSRITKWGRIIRQTRLDELPQFWNVLKGEMSVVGPRPERQHYIEKIIQKTPSYKKLLNIKPGLTSMGQVHYGYAENVDQMCHRMRYDLLYLQNLNLNSDLNIIMKTVKVMLQRKGK